MRRLILAMMLALGVVATRASARQHEQPTAAPHDASSAAAQHAPRSADPAHDAGAAHGAAGEHAPAPLLPSNLQEAKEHFLAPAVWTIVIFLILLIMLYPLAWKPILAGLKAREQRIRQDIADAEAARKRAEETLRQYNAQLASAENSVREMLAKATADGERLATNIRMQAQQEAEEIKERTNRDIDAARDAAVRQVREEAVNLATMMAEKVLRRNLNPDDQRRILGDSLEQMQTIAK